MRKLLVISTVVISLLLLLSIGSSYTGLFHFEPHEERKDYGEWEMVGILNIRNGEESRLGINHIP
jgi:hypothetical protein